MTRINAAKLLIIGTAWLLWGSPAQAQSGRASMEGYVAFEGITWDEVARQGVKAKIEMRPISIKTDPVVKGETESHGNCQIKTIHMGEYEVRITSPGY